MVDVKMPDGTIIRNVPPGITQVELTRRLGLAQNSPAPGAEDDVSFGAAAGRSFVNKMLDLPEKAVHGVLSALTPHPVGEGRIPGPLHLLSSLTKAATGGRVDPQASGAAFRERGPNLGLARDINAGAEVISQLPGAIKRGQPLELGERFANAQADEEIKDIRAAQDAPIGTAVGSAAGDIATLLIARAPFKAAGLGQASTAAIPRAQTVIGQALKTFAQSSRKVGGRALETGVEGAFLASLEDVDPLAVGTGGAAAQVVGDTALATFRKLSKPANLMGVIALGTIGTLGLQQLTPGGLDRVLPTFEGRNKEAILALVLSGVAGPWIGGRIPKNFAGPAFAEIANVIRRGPMLSLFKSLARDPVRVGPVVQKFVEDPEYFGDRSKRILLRAISSEKIDLSNTVEHLMQNDRQFKRKFGKMMDRLAAEAKAQSME